jgi:hypothetical protein
MSNNRDLLRKDMNAIRDDWWIPIILISPDGVPYNKQVGTENDLLGGTRKDPKLFNDENGNPVTIKASTITILVADLERVPAQGEQWIVKYPKGLIASGELVTAAFTANNEEAGSDSLGYIKIFPQAVKVVA